MNDELPPPSEHDVYAQLQAISGQLDDAIEYLHDLRTSTENRDYRTKIIDFNMPFLALVGILVKIALASIPAMILLAIIVGIGGFLIMTLLAGTMAIAPLLAPDPVATPMPPSVAPVTSTPRSSSVTPTPTFTPAPFVPTNLALTAIDSQAVDGIQTVSGVFANRGSDTSPAVTVVIVFQASGRSPVQQRAVLDPIPPGQSAEFTVTNALPGDWSYLVQLEDYVGRPISFRDLAE